MAEENINVQDLEKEIQKTNSEESSEKISTEGHSAEVSPEEAASDEQSHSVDVNLDRESNMINSKSPQVIETAQEGKPSQAIEAALEQTEASQVTEAAKTPEPAQETKPSQVTKESQEPEPSQKVEAAQEQEEKGLGGFDLNQEGTCVVSASTPAVKVSLPFDLNVVDVEGLEDQLLAPSDLQKSPREVNSERLNIDLNHMHDEDDGLALDLNHYIPSPPASPSPSSSSSSVPQPEEHSHASVFRTMGANVVICPERAKCGDPKIVPPSSNGKATLLFGCSIGGMAARACSPSDLNEHHHLLSLSCSSSTGGLKRKEPEGGLEPYMVEVKKVANSSSSTVCGKRKEPKDGQEPYEASTKRTCSC